MKCNKKLTRYVSMAILCVCLTGCASGDVEPLANGYKEVTYTQNSISEPQSHQISLQYTGSNGKQVMIWPSATGGKIVKNEVVIFEADKAWKLPKPDERWPMKPRVFVARAPDFPLDITDEIVGRWAQASGKDVVKAISMAGIVYFEEKNNELDFHFVFWTTKNWPDTVITLNWNQISDIMREVKEKGVVHKDLRWGTSYIEKEFKPEIQK